MLQFIYDADFFILDLINKYFSCKALDIIMPAITRLGNAGIIWIILAIICLITKKYRKTGIVLTVGLLLGLLIGNLFMKNVFARLRPFQIKEGVNLLIAAPKDFSFPSGHTLASFISATVLSIRHKKSRVYVIVLAALISFSRLYLYVHFPTDVLGGIVLGVLIGILSNYLVEKIAKKQKV